MEETEYEAEMNALGARHSGVDLIEFALNRNLAKHFDDLLWWAEGRLYELIVRYLRKFDAWNVKTVLRGIYSGADREEIEADLIGAGEFTEDYLRRLIDAESIELLVEELEGTIFSDQVDAAYGDFEDTGLLIPLENAVDRAFFENLVGDIDVRSEATELYVEFLQAEIDFRNIRNAFRLARSGADIDPSEYYIEGGRLFSEVDVARLADNPEELQSFVQDSTYGDALSAAFQELEGTDSLIGFERDLEAALLRYGDRMSHLFPLSICPVLAYVLAKEREVDNIRAIARGRAVGLSETEIQEELVML
jgi:V/A-type H+-transporting ATPase subunit C